MTQSVQTSAAEKEEVSENGFMEIEEVLNVNGLFRWRWCVFFGFGIRSDNVILIVSDDAVANNVATAGPNSRTHNKNGRKWRGKGKGKWKGKKTKDKKSALLIHFRRK